MAKRFSSIWPPPVYCAQFADGSTMRMSFATPAGKPIDYARGRHLCCAIRGREVAPYNYVAGYFESIEYRKVLRHYAQKLIDSAVAELCGTPMPVKRKRYYVVDMAGNRHRRVAILGWGSIPLFRSSLPSIAPAADIVDGWVEKGDETFPDPHFAPQSTAEVIQLPKRRKVQSDLDKALALLARLSIDDQAILRERMAA